MAVANTEDFIAQAQDYFGAKYTKTQLSFVSQWAEQRTPRQLDLIFRYLVANDTTQFKALPSVARMREVWREVYEAYPELRIESYNQQRVAASRQVTDDAGWTDEEAEEAFRKLKEKLQ